MAGGNGNGGDGGVPEDDNVAASNAASRQYDWRPRPDPTVLTTMQLRDTESQLNQTIAERIAALRELLSQRLDGMDEATRLLSHRMEETARDLDGRSAQREATLDALTSQRMTAIEQAARIHEGEVRNILTGLAEQREHLRKEFAAADQALRELMGARISAMDKATELLASDMRSVPSMLEERLKGLRDLIGERLDAIDRATSLRLQAADSLPSQTREQVDQLRKLHEERFSSIVQQFAERDTRGEQEKKASKEALDAALLAQKESVSQQNDANTTAATKTETNFTKQIDLVGSQITALDKSLTDRISELKERIDRGEGSTSGAQSVTGTPFDASTYRQYERAAEQAAETARAAQGRAITALVISGVLLLVSLASVIFAVTKK